MTTFTPGPWTAIQDDTAEREWYVVTEEEDVMTLGMSEPDARLIAAAPDMADLARNVAGLDDHVVTYGDIRTLRDLIIEWRDAARAAIAKAEGRS